MILEEGDKIGPQFGDGGEGNFYIGIEKNRFNLVLGIYHKICE